MNFKEEVAWLIDVGQLKRYLETELRGVGWLLMSVIDLSSISFGPNEDTLVSNKDMLSFVGKAFDDYLDDEGLTEEDDEDADEVAKVVEAKERALAFIKKSFPERAAWSLGC